MGAVCYYVKNLWVHAPAAPVLTQALLSGCFLINNNTLACLFDIPHLLDTLEYRDLPIVD